MNTYIGNEYKEVTCEVYVDDLSTLHVGFGKQNCFLLWLR